jgi:hypothetical protein
MEKRKRTKSKSKTRSLAKTARIQNNTEILMECLKTRFPELTIHRMDKSDHIYIYGYACDDETNCECFGLKVIEDPTYYIELDHIKYKYGDRCNLTGTQIIQGLTDAFRDAKTPKVVLYDVAKMFVTVNAAPYGVRLFVYNILLHGESWYNKYGYVSATHLADKKHNDVVIHKKVSKVTYKKMNEMCPDCFDETILQLTNQEFMEKLDKLVRDKTISYDKKQQYNKVLAFIDAAYSKSLRYNFYLEQEF